MKLRASVREVMKKEVIKVDTDDAVTEAAKKMKKHGVGSVMVMNGSNYAGIITTTDIVYKHVAEQRGDKCGDIMTEELVVIGPEATIEDAARKMTKYRVEKLPVLENAKLVGIITNNDILKVEPELFEILIERLKMEGDEDED